jgi:hypothetical protein
MRRYRVYFNTDERGHTPGYRDTITARSIAHVREIIANDSFYHQFGGIWRVNAL